MPSVIHGIDKFTDLPVASATEKGGAQSLYGISQHRTILEEKKSFSGLRPLESQQHPFGI